MEEGQVEKMHVLRLVFIGLIMSFITQLFIVYGQYPRQALFQFAFYKGLLNGLAGFVLFPYLFAYLMGRVLSSIAYLLGEPREYPTQYFLSWLLCFLFALVAVRSAWYERHELAWLVKECENQWQGSNASTQAGHEAQCIKKAMSLYPKLKNCTFAVTQQTQCSAFNTLFR